VDTCYYCNRTASATWMTTDNRPACRDCTPDLADCPHCLRVILPGDGVVDYEKAVYCYRCADQHPRCRHCEEPLFAEDSGPCCAACSQKTFCRLCQRDCSAAYYLDEFGPRCSYCCTCKNCGERGADVVDFKCPGCASAPVMTLEEGLALYPAAYEFIRDVMDLTIERIPRLLVSLEMPDVQVREYPEGLRKGHTAVGYCGYDHIWVRGGRHEHFCLLTLVHELAHAWQAENCPYQSDALTEGFARWLQYKCALHLNYPVCAEQFREDLCPVYGGGPAQVPDVGRRRGPHTTPR